MERLGKIREYLRAYILEQLPEKIQKAQAAGGEDVLAAARGVLEQALETQKIHAGWEPACLALLHLKTGLAAETEEFQLLLADRGLYLDELQKIQDWNPVFWERDIREEENMKKELQKRFVRLQQYEISYASHWIRYEQRSLVGVYWNTHLQELLKLEEFRKLRKGIPFFFLFGDYLGDLFLSLKYEGEE